MGGGSDAGRVTHSRSYRTFSNSRHCSRLASRQAIVLTLRQSLHSSERNQRAARLRPYWTERDRGSIRDRHQMQNLTLEEGVPIRMERWEPRVAWVSHYLIRNGICRFDRCGFNQHRAVGTYAAGNVDPVPRHSAPSHAVQALSPPFTDRTSATISVVAVPGKLAGAASTLVVSRSCQTEYSARDLPSFVVARASFCSPRGGVKCRVRPSRVRKVNQAAR